MQNTAVQPPYTYELEDNMRKVHVSDVKLDNYPKSLYNNIGSGETFRYPYISPDAEDTPMGINTRLWQAQVAASTPNKESLDNCGGAANFLPGPQAYSDPSFNPNPADKLNLCSQNWNGMGTSTVSASLLPSPSSTEKFSDCNINNTNALANQTFLSAVGQIGYSTGNFGNRNSNYDLRAVVPNPHLSVGPWNLSTTPGDLLRRPLEGPAPSMGMYGNAANSASNPVTIYE